MLKGSGGGRIAEIVAEDGDYYRDIYSVKMRLTRSGCDFLLLLFLRLALESARSAEKRLK